MRRRRRKLWLPGALLLLCLGLAWLVYQQLAASTNQGALARAPAGPELDLGDLPAAPEFVLDSIERYDAVLERPLFSPTRRPPEEEVVAAVPTRMEFDYVLKGVLIDGDSRIALLRDYSGDRVLHLREGESLDGWRLKSVAADHVVVERGDREEALELSFEFQ